MSDQDSRLAAAVEAIHARFGREALYRPGNSATRTPARLSTGFAALDEALGGGLPRGRLTEIGGLATAGVVTMALKVVAGVHALPVGRSFAGEITTFYLDVGQTFDPTYAHRCGVSLERLLLLHPRHYAQALSLLQDLVMNQAGGVLVLDLPAPLTAANRVALSGTLDRLLVPLAHANALLLCLNTRPAAEPAPQAAVRLWLERERWLYHRHDIHGYRVQVHILKNKGGRAGQQVPLSFTCAGLPGRS